MQKIAPTLLPLFKIIVFRPKLPSPGFHTPKNISELFTDFVKLGKDPAAFPDEIPKILFFAGLAQVLFPRAITSYDDVAHVCNPILTACENPNGNWGFAFSVPVAFDTSGKIDVMGFLAFATYGDKSSIVFREVSSKENKGASVSIRINEFTDLHVFSPHLFPNAFPPAGRKIKYSFAIVDNPNNGLLNLSSLDAHFLMSYIVSQDGITRTSTCCFAKDITSSDTLPLIDVYSRF